METPHFIWDLPDDPAGNVQHLELHDVTQDEAEDVLLDRGGQTTRSRSSGERLTFGHTAAGRYLAVVWQHVADDPLTIRPITAYDAPEPRRRKRN